MKKTDKTDKTGRLETLDERLAFGGYVEYALESGALPFLDRLWAVRRRRKQHGAAGHWRLPDPRPSLVVRRFHAPDGRLERVTSYLNGSRTAPFAVAFDPMTDSFGIKLNPEWLPSLFGVTAADIKNSWVYLSEISDAHENELATIAASCTDPQDGAMSLLRLTNRRFEKLSRASEPASVVSHASALLRGSAGRVGVRDVARELAVSPRHLHRLVRTQTGHSPKELARIWRFLAAVEDAERARPVQWACLARQFGFSDQPHLVREFQEFSRMTPVQLIAQRRRDLANWKLVG